MHEDEIPHPLDQDDDAPIPRPRPPQDNSRAYRPLLTFGVRVAIGSAVVTALASAASANAPLNSNFAIAAYWVFRTAAFILLGSFGCILVAYRIPYLRPFSLPQAGKAKTMIQSRFGKLLFINGVFLAVVWVLTILAAIAGSVNIFGWIWVLNTALTSIVTLAIALLVTMIVFHHGIFRAYAIGVLVAIACQLPAMLYMFAFLAQRSRGPASFGGMQFATPIGMTLATAAGLLCAGYVWLLNLVPGTPSQTPTHTPSRSEHYEHE